MTTNKDVIYLRKSREDIELEAKGQNETLARHRKELINLAERQGLNVVKIYEEIVSGDSIEERPQVQLLLSEVMKGKYDNILVMELQRIARGNTKDQGIVLEALEMSKTKIVTPTKTYDPNNDADMEMIEFGLLLSRRELKAISRRMHFGVMKSVEEGNYMGAYPPIGYDIVKEGKRNRYLVPNEKAKLVQQIYSWNYHDNMGCGEIARKLMSLGIPTARGGYEWTRSSIMDILQNDTYTGKIRWHRRRKAKEYIDGKIEKTNRRSKRGNMSLFEGKHEGIISQEMFDEVQKKFGMRAPTNSRNLRNMLAGLLFCKVCGKAYAYLTYDSRGGTTKPRLQHRETAVCKGNKSSYAQVVFDDVIEAIKGQINDCEIAIKEFNTNGEVEKYNKEKALLLAEAEKLNKKKSQLFDWLEEGIYTKSEFIERKSELTNKILNINKAIDQLEEPKVDEIKLKSAKLSEVVQSVGNPTVSVNKKNQLLKAVIERIEYTNTTGTPELDIYFK